MHLCFGWELATGDGAIPEEVAERPSHAPNESAVLQHDCVSRDERECRDAARTKEHGNERALVMADILRPRGKDVCDTHSDPTGLVVFARGHGKDSIQSQKCAGIL